MNKKKLFVVLIPVIVIILIILAFIFLKPNSNRNINNITGTYKMMKGEKEGKILDYSNINMVYSFYEDGKGEIIFEEVVSPFTYSLSKKDKDIILTLTSKEGVSGEYKVTFEDENLILSNDVIGEILFTPTQLKELDGE